MKNESNFSGAEFPDSPTVAFSMAALKTNRFFEFHAKNCAYLHTLFNRARFETLMPKYGIISPENIHQCTLLGSGSRV